MGPPTCEIKPLLQSDEEQKRIGIVLIIIGSILFVTCIFPVICSPITQEQRTHMPMPLQTAAAVFVPVVTTQQACQA